MKMLQQAQSTEKSRHLERNATTIVKVVVSKLKAATTYVKSSIFSLSRSRSFYSLLFAFCATLLLADKFVAAFGIQGPKFGFSSFSNFVWVLSQSIVPILLITIVYIGKPYLVSLTSALHCYTVQLVWIFKPEYPSDSIFLQLYGVGTVISFILILCISKLIRKRNKIKLSEIQQTQLELRKTIESFKEKIS